MVRTTTTLTVLVLLLVHSAWSHSFPSAVLVSNSGRFLQAKGQNDYHWVRVKYPQQSPSHPISPNSDSNDHSQGGAWRPTLLPKSDRPTFTPYIGARALTNLPEFFQHLRQNLAAAIFQRSGRRLKFMSKSRSRSRSRQGRKLDLDLKICATKGAGGKCGKYHGKPKPTSEKIARPRATGGRNLLSKSEEPTVTSGI